MSMRQLKITKSITVRESPGLEKYLREIDKVSLLSPEEEVQLAQQIKDGDKDALDRLTKANLRFVVSVAKQYQGQGLSLQDLINEGNMGLIKAAHHFDASRGFRFISFAVWWIRQYIIQALASQARLIRLPMHRVALGKRIQNAQSHLEQELERMPTDEELAEALNMETKDIDDVLEYKEHHMSLDAPFTEEEDSSMIDIVEDPNADNADSKVYHSESLSLELKRSMNKLTERQKETLCYFFGIGIDHPMSLDEISRKFHITTERVRQIKEKAITRLKTLPNIDILRTYLRA
ncbi:MAG TPA: RNA polymerase sigma factor RpoD/SigA [Chitinophagaceae bacterium]|nr:RNA polymerase sigma factor RpoD/SigA [Chitinophagaceae bacterium]